MGKITAVNLGKGRGQKAKVYLDGKLAITLENEVAVGKRLQVGQEFAEDKLKALLESNNYIRCLNAAVRYLGYRPRSEAELRERLIKKGFTAETVEAVIAKQKEQGLVDDAAFAEFWKDNRNSFSPRSSGMLKIELKRKGVAPETIDCVVGTVDNRENAYRSALNKARRLAVDDYTVFRNKLGGYLRRRGFSYGVIDSAVKQLWQEKRRV